MEQLTAREKEVYECLTAGMSNKEIAQQLDIAVHTVEKHLDNIYRKLNTSSRLETISKWFKK